MTTGEIIVLKFGSAKKGGERDEDDVEELHGEGESSKDGYFPNMGVAPPQMGEGEWVEEVLEIGHLARWKVDGFKPVAIFTPKRGEVLACAISDIGESRAIP